MCWWNLYSWSLQNVFLVFRYIVGVFILYTCLGIMTWLIAMFEMLGCLVGFLIWRQLEGYSYQMILVGTGQSWCLSPRNGARDAFMSVLHSWFGLGWSWNIIVLCGTIDRVCTLWMLLWNNDRFSWNIHIDHYSSVSTGSTWSLTYPRTWLKCTKETLNMAYNGSRRIQATAKFMGCSSLALFLEMYLLTRVTILLNSIGTS